MRLFLRLFIIKNEASYNVRYFKEILFAQEHMGGLVILRQLQLDFVGLSCSLDEYLGKDEWLDRVDIHGGGCDVGASAHLADALADYRVEVVFDVVVGSVVRRGVPAWEMMGQFHPFGS